eukprot:2950301-Pleurochrysis_carterae.AAC.1
MRLCCDVAPSASPSMPAVPQLLEDPAMGDHLPAPTAIERTPTRSRQRALAAARAGVECVALWPLAPAHRTPSTLRLRFTRTRCTKRARTTTSPSMMVRTAPMRPLTRPPQTRGST